MRVLMTAALVVLAATLAGGWQAACAQAPVADYFSTTSLKDGQPLAAGATLEAYDGDGVRCGLAIIDASGGFLIHVNGDDPMTATIDEGAREGEMLEWRLDGQAIDPAQVLWVANVIGLFADLRFENGAAKEMQIQMDTTAVEEATWGNVKAHYRR